MTWSAVCSDEWDDNDARVVCGMLLYDPKGECISACTALPYIDANLMQTVGLLRDLEKMGECQCFLSRLTVQDLRHTYGGREGPSIRVIHCN